MTPLEEVKKLIAIPSVTGEEEEIARYLESRFQQLGCKTRLYEAAKNRYNIYAEYPGRDKSRPGVLFHGHMDTVPPYGMPNPYSPDVNNGRVWGRGSVDQKAGIAAVISAFEDYLSSSRTPEKSIAFIGVIDEESEHRGSMAMKEMGIDADFGIVTEPTDLKFGIGCKGTAPVLLSVKGRAAHGCRPWLGVNAVVAGIKLAEKIMSEELPVYTIEGIGDVQGSYNLGKIEGGNAYNIVADRCAIWFDRRLTPGETQAGVVEDIRKAADTMGFSDELKIDIEIARPDWNWPPIKERGLLPAITDMSRPEVSGLKKLCDEVLGFESRVYFTDGYNEMDFLINDLGINTIQFGPGDSARCHTDDEYLDIEQLQKCTDVYKKIISFFCE